RLRKLLCLMSMNSKLTKKDSPVSPALILHPPNSKMKHYFERPPISLRFVVNFTITADSISTMTKSIDIHLSFSEPQAHYVDVAMHIRGFDDRESLDVKLPVWTPGSYLTRQYPKHVERLSVVDGQGDAVPFETI